MEQNNNTPANKPSENEYSFPHNKEQFQNVLRQAQQGQYQQTANVFTEQQSDSQTTANANNVNNANNAYKTNAENTYSFPQEQPRQYDDRVHYSADDITRQNDFYGYQQPVYSSRFTPAKKKFNPLVIILPLILLIIAAAVIFFILLNNTVSYRKAEENYFNSLSNSFFEKYDKILEKNKSSVHQKAEIKVSIPAAELAEIELNDIFMCADSAVSGETVYGMIDAVIGKRPITLESWTNRENFTNILFIPEITDLYLYLKPNIEQNGTDDLNELYNDIFGKISEFYFELAGDPPVEKNVEFTVNGKVFKADRYIVKIDGIGTARLFKKTAEVILDNEAAAEALCKSLGYKNKAELMESEAYKKMLKETDDIINGAKNDGKFFLMTVYVKNKTVIGREIVFADEELSDGAAADDTGLYNMSGNADSELKNVKEIAENLSGKLYINIYEIPTEKGNFTHIYFKTSQNALNYDGTDKMYTSEIYLVCDDEIDGNDKNIHSGTLNLGFTDTNGDSNTFTANYTELSVTEELFQGKINMAYSDTPALSMTVELNTDGDKKLLDLTVPNILTANLTLSPSELEFKEAPVLIEGQYVEIPGDSQNKSAAEAKAREKLQEDVLAFVYKIMGVDLYGNENSGNENDFLNTSEEKDEHNGNGDPTTLAPIGEDNGSETTVNEENVTEITETAPSETSAAETKTETQDVQTPETAPDQNKENETTAPVITPTASIDTGNAQKITGAQIDSFNNGNYYKTEIYVDGEKGASENISVTELKGRFDSYVKGKVLQIDFAEGYDFDSALIVLTFSAETISGGRNYPDSPALKGLDRYMVLGADEDYQYGDREIECYKYSDRQIGFIVEKSGYYYVTDMDDFFYSVMGISPDEIINE